MSKFILRNQVLYCALFTTLAFSLTLAGQDSLVTPLPKPQTNKGRPLMQVLKDRKSSREFSAEKLTQQELSDLLWAGFGINRPETGGRTAPSARNMQEIDVYVVTAQGLFLYDAKANALRKLSGGDIMASTGKQPFVKDAALNLVFVVDYSRVKTGRTEDSRMYAAMDAAFVSENVYLYCASEGLATVVRGSVDRPALAKAMGLKESQEIMLAQTVGYPKK
jgi:SagB-type dehydrogenase family enzyme